MPNLPKRIFQFIIIFILLLTPLTFLVKEVKANPYYNQSPSEIIDSLNQIDQNSKNSNGTLINDVGVKFREPDLTTLGWTSKIIPLRECKDPANNIRDPKTQEKCVTGTAVGFLLRSMDSMYNAPPASFDWYAKDFLANAGIVKPAYAQGIGFTGLQPLLFLWKASRNIAYTILVLVMVAIGFMIIFRMKIDPKTVISVQAAIPKIIVTLLLVTFSYAIAGLLIDLMYVVIAIIISVLGNAVSQNSVIPGAKFLTDTVHQQEEFFTGGWWKLITSVFSIGMVPSLFYQFFGGSILNTLIGGGGTIGIFTLPALLTTSAFSPLVLLGLTPIPILLFIIGLGLLFTLIRLTLLLVNSYIQVIIAVILGPILILQEAIPGKSAFSGWLLNLMANLSVFPATVAIIYFSWIVTATAMSGKLWGAPLTPVGGGSEVGGGNPLAIIMGLGIIFLAPNLVASIKKIFQPKPTLPITAGTMLSPITGAASTTMGAASQFYYLQQIGGARGPLAGILGRLGSKFGRPQE